MLRDQKLQTIISELNGIASAGLLISEASLLDGLQSSLIEEESWKHRLRRGATFSMKKIAAGLERKTASEK